MYLSRLTLSPRSRQVRREASEPYEMHRTIMSAFPSNEDGDPGRVLFRLEEPTRASQHRRGLTLLVQSENQPDWTDVSAKQRYLLPIAEDNPAVKPYSPTFAADQRLIFRLRANPTIKREGKRLGLYREEEQRAWLARKAEQGGFDILTVNLTREGMTEGKIHRPTGESHHLRLLAVRFDGVLRIVDPIRFLESIQRGIGSGKGLGFGLLSVARG